MEDSVMAEAALSEDAVAGEALADNAAEEIAAPQKKQKKPINQQKLQDNLWGWTFCIPLIVGTIWFVYIAFVLAVMLSFTRYKIGSGNVTLFGVIGDYGKYLITDDGTESTAGGIWHWYRQIFTYEIASGTTAQSLGIVMNEAGMYFFNTVFYMIGIPIGMVLSVFFAVCMSRDIKGGNLFRVIYYLPCISSSVAIVYTFKLLFRTSGVINQMFNSSVEWLVRLPGEGSSWNSLTGGTSTAAFMVDPYWCQGLITKCVIIIMSVWKGLGGTIILYAAGLSGVNASTKEAAEIDGANGWRIFWKITMPDLYPVIFYNIVTSVIGGLQIYAEPEMMMNGMDAKYSGYVSLIYYYGRTYGYAGAGSAYGIVLALVIFVLTLFQFWLDSRNKD